MNWIKLEQLLLKPVPARAISHAPALEHAQLCEQAQLNHMHISFVCADISIIWRCLSKEFRKFHNQSLISPHKFTINESNRR